MVLILPPHYWFKGLIKGRVLPRCGRKRAPNDSITFLFLSSCFFLFFFLYKKIFLKNQKNTKTVCVLCTLVLVYLGWPLKQSFINFVSLVALCTTKQVNFVALVCDE